MPISLSLPDLEATAALARRWVPLLKTGDCLALYGPLGAGKTAFARALIESFGVTGEIPSPTFTLLQTYETMQMTLFHFDLYRLKNAHELEELGWDDALTSGVTIVEWPERAGNFLPYARFSLRFFFNEDGSRRVEIEEQGGNPDRVKALL